MLQFRESLFGEELRNNFDTGNSLNYIMPTLYNPFFPPYLDSKSIINLFILEIYTFIHVLNPYEVDPEENSNILFCHFMFFKN